ncbi:hypothetical protein A2954_02735 [Candidatus Roizmanbacteria bacterium RIFCSPLOWO2_01_FULL_37_12]|uniref:Uncharacterized protein n=1 Tax=Candidatus Roizmanbacteria bacterium RIFCSPLOWO2_01_FULL_37_12 TaxID=1802056 RepID=A0A1F7IF02_9BACT|nr:MAG: hypothetical protein A2767_02260 [Candidatus Roizmanbacteria bacterium RIFCSPHIGHO2_01_FULL_35_10]OGK41941.1 MAG: hypothetical protein A2954_02735 [Candidatus Roizmanbacteria bacterium RIFCSPLOWO2_01_FULL_37_12]
MKKSTRGVFPKGFDNGAPLSPELDMTISGTGRADLPISKLHKLGLIADPILDILEKSTVQSTSGENIKTRRA